jgi:hypothetical protein
MLLGLWGLQLLLVGWHFAPQVRELAERLRENRLGLTVWDEDPFYQWLRDLEQVMPRKSAYILLDQYEAGRYIEARYHLYPRRQVLLSPQTPPSYLFYALRQHEAEFLLIRDRRTTLGTGALAVIYSPVAQEVPLSGPGLAYRVDYQQFHGFFYE